MIAYKEVPSARPRAAARATTRRHKRARVRRYASVTRVFGVLMLLLVPVIGYVMLTSNLTGLNYAVAHASHERAVLQEDVQRLDDRIAHLQSRERLATIAAQLGMREAHEYAVVNLPAPHPVRKHSSGVAFLGWFTSR